MRSTAMIHPAAAELFRPTEHVARWVYEIMLVLCGSALIAASAWVEIIVPFSPVPITGQTFAVLLIGALYGPRLGALTLVAYLAEGAAGLPVFAGGGFGVHHLLGPTGGYLFGFVPAAALVGVLAKWGWDRNVLMTISAMSLGTVVIFLCGLAWLVFFVGPANVLATGFIPYLPGAAVKIALAAAVLPCGWKVLSSLRV